MIPEVIIPVFIVFIVIGLPVLCVTLISLAKIMRGESGIKGKGKGGSSRDEAELIQDIHRTLTRLENRIDSLETIVLENPTTKKS